MVFYAFLSYSYFVTLLSYFQPTFTCSNSTIETLEQGRQYVQS